MNDFIYVPIRVRDANGVIHRFREDKSRGAYLVCTGEACNDLAVILTEEVTCDACSAAD